MLHEDNQSAIKLATNPVFHMHARTKHLDIRLHYVRELIEKVEVQYCHTQKMIAEAIN